MTTFDALIGGACAAGGVILIASAALLGEPKGVVAGALAVITGGRLIWRSMDD